MDPERLDGPAAPINERPALPGLPVTLGGVARAHPTSLARLRLLRAAR